MVLKSILDVVRNIVTMPEQMRMQQKMHSEEIVSLYADLDKMYRRESAFKSSVCGALGRHMPAGEVNDECIIAIVKRLADR